MAYSLRKDIHKEGQRRDSAFIYQELMLEVKDSIFATEKLNEIKIVHFLNLLIHKLLVAVTHNSPVQMLLALVCLAALLARTHYRLEHWITNQMEEKAKIQIGCSEKDRCGI